MTVMAFISYFKVFGPKRVQSEVFQVLCFKLTAMLFFGKVLNWGFLSFVINILIFSDFLHEVATAL